MIKTIKSRRGISMVEVIVALTVIVIVSAAALSLITAHTHLEARTAQTIEATNIAENAVECFRFNSTEEGFKNAFLQTDVSYDETEGIDTSGSLTAKIEIDDNTNTITVVVKNASGDTLVDVTYTK